MNILISADYATPASGNFIASCVELGRYLTKNGDHVTFIFPKNLNTLSNNSWVCWLKEEGFPVYLTKKDQTDQEVLYFLKEIIRNHKIDILHIHFGLFHHTAMKYAKELNIKILIHDHMDFPAMGDLQKHKSSCLLRSLLYRMKGIGVASVNPHKNSAYFFAKHWYIPNGLSLIRNISKTSTRDDVRFETGISPGEKVCLFLGWDMHRKGLDIAVKAVHHLRCTDPTVILAIVGMGDPPNPERLSFISNSTGIDPDSSWIRYLPSREDMFAYHRAADVYLSASRSEAFSYGILEAISENVPVAVSDIAGTSWCHHYSKAVVYSTEDFIACASAIDKALSIGKSESNADSIINQYSIEKWCKQMISVYNSL